ncbi:MAG TPA: hypothetical protein VH143_31700 [Kofleriaceae bacterium]|jgi:hypothetical protein|nr:hypothetical protein [Kofleriaceae bacterium]
MNRLAHFAGMLAGGFAPDLPRDANVDIHALDPGVSTEPFEVEQIVEVAWFAEGRGDGPASLAVARLADGRWIYVSHLVEITGDLYWTYRFAATRERLWFWACTDDDRARLSAQLTRDELDAELVALDAMLDSGDGSAVALAERRMLQRATLRA